MTKQEIFELICKALLKQNKRSTGKVRAGTNRDGTPLYDDRCRYRGDGGCKCAAGFLIPDPVYDPLMEGSLFGAIYNDPRFYELQKLSLSSPAIRLVEKLQSIHDGVEVSLWREQMHELGKQERFDVSFLDA